MGRPAILSDPVIRHLEVAGQAYQDQRRLANKNIAGGFIGRPAFFCIFSLCPGSSVAAPGRQSKKVAKKGLTVPVLWFFADLYHRQSKNRAFFGLTLGGSPLPRLLLLRLLLLLLLLWSLSYSFIASSSLLGSHPDTELLTEAALLPDAELSKMRNSSRRQSSLFCLKSAALLILIGSSAYLQKSPALLIWKSCLEPGSARCDFPSVDSGGP